MADGLATVPKTWTVIFADFFHIVFHSVLTAVVSQIAGEITNGLIDEICVVKVFLNMKPAIAYLIGADTLTFHLYTAEST